MLSHLFNYLSYFVIIGKEYSNIVLLAVVYTPLYIMCTYNNVYILLKSDNINPQHSTNYGHFITCTSLLFFRWLIPRRKWRKRNMSTLEQWVCLQQQIRATTSYLFNDSRFNYHARVGRRCKSVLWIKGKQISSLILTRRYVYTTVSCTAGDMKGNFMGCG